MLKFKMLEFKILKYTTRRTSLQKIIIRASNMQLPDSRHTRITTLIDIGQKRDEIHNLFRNSIHSSLGCNDFVQVQSAVIQHFKEAIKYINRCINSISAQYPQSNVQLLEIDSFIGAAKPKYPSSHHPHTIDQIEFQLRELGSAIDQWVFMIRDCPDLENKPHVLLLAKAMCEIFEIQHFYIYPYRADLMPDYLKGTTDKISKDWQMK